MSRRSTTPTTSSTTTRTSSPARRFDEHSVSTLVHGYLDRSWPAARRGFDHAPRRGRPGRARRRGRCGPSPVESVVVVVRRNPSIPYWQPPPGRRDRVALTGVRLFADQQLLACRLPGGQVDDGRLPGEIAGRVVGRGRHLASSAVVSCARGSPTEPVTRDDSRYGDSSIRAPVRACPDRTVSRAVKGPAPRSCGRASDRCRRPGRRRRGTFVTRLPARPAPVLAQLHATGRPGGGGSPEGLQL